VSTSSGIITTVAGTGQWAYSGDGGLATSATLYYPGGVTVDASGNLYIADTSNHRIRMVSASSGIITTVAGTGQWAYSGDGGLATSATLYDPRGVTVDASGNLYIADTNNHRVRATQHYCYLKVSEVPVLSVISLRAIVGAIVSVTFLVLLIVGIQARRLKNRPVKPFGIYVALRSSPPSDVYSP
jgi:sugar lactone lactonase YvrE